EQGAGAARMADARHARAPALHPGSRHQQRARPQDHAKAAARGEAPAMVSASAPYPGACARHGLPARARAYASGCVRTPSVTAAAIVPATTLTARGGLGLRQWRKAGRRSRDLEHRGMDAIGRRVSVEEGLDVDDDLLPHIDA